MADAKVSEAAKEWATAHRFSTYGRCHVCGSDSVWTFDKVNKTTEQAYDAGAAAEREAILREIEWEMTIMQNRDNHDGFKALNNVRHFVINRKHEVKP